MLPAASSPGPASALSRCLQEEAAAIAAAAVRLSSEQVEAALELLLGCRTRRAKLVVTGVGKSGIVARKIAATFSSIGLTAVFLNPHSRGQWILSGPEPHSTWFAFENFQLAPLRRRNGDRTMFFFWHAFR